MSYKPGGISFTTSITKRAYDAIVQEAQDRIAFCLQNEACYSRKVLVESAHNQNMTIAGVRYEMDLEEQVRLLTMLLVNLIILQQMDPEHCKSHHTGLEVLTKPLGN